MQQFAVFERVFLTQEAFALLSFVLRLLRLQR